ncbi:MAG: hypothetical protein P8P83_05975 [Rickettsiaceae bacterium]|nr:hypothetical protein [Rickettsiaceae bacterium]
MHISMGSELVCGSLSADCPITVDNSRVVLNNKIEVQNFLTIALTNGGSITFVYNKKQYKVQNDSASCEVYDAKDLISLVKNKSSKVLEVEVCKEDLFLNAIEKGETNTVIKLIKEGVDVNYQNHQMDDSPLAKSVRKGNMDLCQILIKNGANINHKSMIVAIKEAESKDDTSILKLVELYNSSEELVYDVLIGKSEFDQSKNLPIDGKTLMSRCKLVLDKIYEENQDSLPANIISRFKLIIQKVCEDTMSNNQDIIDSLLYFSNQEKEELVEYNKEAIQKEASDLEIELENLLWPWDMDIDACIYQPFDAEETICFESALWNIEN